MGLAHNCLTVSPLGSQTHYGVIVSVPECIIGINIRSSRQIAHIGPVTCDREAITVVKAMWKALGLRYLEK